MSVTGARISGLESRAWRSLFHDGLWNVALGILFLGVGLSATLNLPRGWTYLEYAAAMALSVALIRVGKRRITIPRLGWVKSGPKAERQRLADACRLGHRPRHRGRVPHSVPQALSELKPGGRQC